MKLYLPLLLLISSCLLTKAEDLKKIEVYNRALWTERDLRILAVSDEALKQLMDKNLILFDWSMIYPGQETPFSKQYLFKAGMTLEETINAAKKALNNYDLRDYSRIKVYTAGKIFQKRYDELTPEMKQQKLRPGDIVLVSRGNEW